MDKKQFSRLQLAAALLEYDNDDSNPNAPRRNAKESAIFAHLRRNLPPRSTTARRSTDYLGAAAPSDTGSMNGRESALDTRKSRGSIDALRNPFGRDSTYGELENEAELEVDLASWGLDAFIPKEKGSKKKGKAPALPNPYDPPPTDSARRPDGGRTSLGSIGNLGELTRPSLDADGRRHSAGDILNMAAPSDNSSHQRRASSYTLAGQPANQVGDSIPFPTAASVRSTSPAFNDNAHNRQSSRLSLLDGHRRTHSAAGSQVLGNEEDGTSQFGIRPPSPDRASRFDPKSARGRTMSNGTFNTMALMETPEEENPFAVRPPSPGRSSRFDPKVARTRTMSNGTLGTQMLLGDDDGLDYGAQPPPRERRYSRLDLMRPKVLVMPSPLQQNVQTSTPEPAREGFVISSDGPPLPPGAKTTTGRAMSMLDPITAGAPIASNAFIPNPRMSMTLSQLTFRNNLMVDGERDVAYADIEDHLKRATEDGQQIEELPEPEPERPSTIIVDEPGGRGRPAGKLFGKSLIDDLEARKAEMKGRQRVFTGDQRPSMMHRTPMKRSSTLIDPEDLKPRPISQRLDTSQTAPNLMRRNSANIKPLLNFDDEIPGAPNRLLAVNNHTNMPASTRSVFGVDTLWERELAKLKEIEAREKADEDERKKREAEEDAKKSKKKGKGKKGKEKRDSTLLPEQAPGNPIEEDVSLPHILPAIQRASTQRPPPPPNDDEDSEESDNSEDSLPKAPVGGKPNEEWFAGSSDEEDTGPRRTTGSGPRYPNQIPPRFRAAAAAAARNDEDSSEEDIPLVATIGRAAQRATRVNSLGDDDEDEDKPISMLLDQTKSKYGGSLSPELGTKINSPVRANDDEEDDDEPLGLRASRVIPSQVSGNGGDDDDQPLGLRPDQMRRTQYMNMMAAQQQQQLMMQAQMQQSMMFGAPSIMSGGFFGPPMAPPMMMPPPILPGTPPPMHDANKFGRVDKWRHDVAVEGQPPSA
ncbi:hypothetical protein ABKN59_000583 [Abortiporus biennis]